MRIVITGANRGIGLALARRYAARGDEVHGTARDVAGATELASVPGVSVHALDVQSDASVAAFAAELGTAGVDVLVNNAGRGHWEGLAEFDPKLAIELFDTNAVGPVRVTRALLPMLKKAAGKVFHMSSGLASISDNQRGGSYAYRMSKAALNMAARTLAMDLAKEGVASIVLEPGWVKTDMGGASATISADESAAQLAAIIDERGLESTGKFFRRDGTEFPW